MTSAAFQQKCVPRSFSNDYSPQVLKLGPKSSTPADQLSKTNKKTPKKPMKNLTGISNLVPSKWQIIIFVPQICCWKLSGSNFEYLLIVAPHSTNCLTQDPTVQFVRSINTLHPKSNQTGQRNFKTGCVNIPKLASYLLYTCLSCFFF